MEEETNVKVEEAKKIADKADAKDMVAEAIKATEKLAEQNAILEKHLKALESRKVKQVLSGRADVSPSEPAEESPSEYKERVLRGEL